MAPAAMGEKVQGLAALLDAAKLVPYREAAEAWCDAVGAVEAAELVEATDEFADALGLKLMERRRLQKVAATWDIDVADQAGGKAVPASTAETRTDGYSENAQDEPLPEPAADISTPQSMGSYSCQDQSGHYGRAAYHSATGHSSSAVLDTASSTGSFYGSLSMSASGSFYGRPAQRQPTQQASSDLASEPSTSSYYTCLSKHDIANDCSATVDTQSKEFSCPGADGTGKDSSSWSEASWKFEPGSEAAVPQAGNATRSQASGSYDGLAELLDHDLVLAALAQAEETRDVDALQEAIARAEAAGISVLKLRSACKALTVLQASDDMPRTNEDLAKQRRIEMRRSKEAKWNFGGRGASAAVNDRVREHEAELEQQRLQAFSGRGRFRSDVADQGEEQAQKHIERARRERAEEFSNHMS